jgi:hypothetical protein
MIIMERENVIQAVSSILEKMKDQRDKKQLEGICILIKSYKETDICGIDYLMKEFKERYKSIFPNDIIGDEYYYAFGVSTHSMMISKWVRMYNLINGVKTISTLYNPFNEVRIKFLQDWLKDLTSGEEEIE